jgi:hypothetical protein
MAWPTSALSPLAGRSKMCRCPSQHGGGSRWGKRAMTVSQGNAASRSLTLPRLGAGESHVREQRRNRRLFREVCSPCDSPLFAFRFEYAIALRLGGGDLVVHSSYAIALPCGGRMRSLSERSELRRSWMGGDAARAMVPTHLQDARSVFRSASPFAGKHCAAAPPIPTFPYKGARGLSCVSPAQPDAGRTVSESQVNRARSATHL